MGVNLHRVVRSAINSINTDQDVVIKLNKGVEHQPGGLQVPVWEEVEDKAQVQPIKSSEIKFINNYNSSSTYRNFYFDRTIHGINRRRLTGGDIIVWDGFEWFVDSNEEDWQTVGWSKVRAIQQLPKDEEEEEP